MYIYFLLHQGQIVYIGQSRNVQQRLKLHDLKEYDSVRIIACDSDKVDYWERRLITYFKPKYNFNHNPNRVERFGDMTSLIHPSYKASHFAKRYFHIQSGEDLTPQQAVNRWRKVRRVDFDVFRKTVESLHEEACVALDAWVKDQLAKGKVSRRGRGLDIRTMKEVFEDVRTEQLEMLNSSRKASKG